MNFVHWGSAVVSEVEFIVKSKVPIIHDIPEDMIKYFTQRRIFEYDFEIERKFLASYPIFQSQEKMQHNNEINELLQPQPVKPPLSDNNAEKSSLDINFWSVAENTHQSPEVVKDFDAPSDDPFMMAELNTINELEELRHVLTADQLTCLNALGRLDTKSPELMQANGPVTETTESSVLTDIRIDNTDTLTYSNIVPRLKLSASNSSLHNSFNSQFKYARGCDSIGVLSASLKDITFPQISESRLVETPRPKITTGLAISSNSLDDFVVILPQTSNTIEIFPPDTENENLVTFTLYDNFYTPDRLAAATPAAPPSPSLQGYVTPTATEEALIKCAVDMGFSKKRALGLVFAGTNASSQEDNTTSDLEREKIFITQLCNLSALTDEEGVPEDVAIASVIASPNDLGKAWDFINIAKELEEMGFSVKSACSALLISNMDKVTALQILLEPNSGIRNSSPKCNSHLEERVSSNGLDCSI